MHYDFIIVGAGIAGASAAFELSRSSRVCLLEGEARPGLHATGRSAALFTPTYGGPQFRALTRASRAFFDHPPAGFCDHPLLQDRGCLYIARTDQREHLQKMVADISASGGMMSFVDRQSALARVPSLRKDYLAEAALDSDAMDIDVHALHQGFLRAARSAGVRLVTGTPLNRLERRDGVWCAGLVDGDVSAPVLINAAGAWADEVARLCGVPPLGLRPLRRTALVVDPPAGVDVRSWPAVIDAEESFYFKPEAGKLLLSPADETPSAPCDAAPEELDIAVAVDRVEAALDIEVRRVNHSWAGLRTFAPDRGPVVGFDARVAGFFWCAGQGGYGIQTSPAMGRVVAALARGDGVPEDVVREGFRVEDVSPRRFVN